MKISDWLDKKEAEQVDVSQIVLPKNMFYHCCLIDFPTIKSAEKQHVEQRLV
jgi:hypothetical protein